MSWNITKEPLYQEMLKKEFARKMRGVNFRKHHLHELFLKEDAEVIKRFPEIVEHWIDGKAFDYLEKLFRRLLLDDRFEAHKACVGALAVEVMKKPENLVKLFTSERLRYHDVIPNPLITAKDNFELLSVYSILQPTVLLTQSEILSETWAKGIERPENSELTFATLSLINYRAHGFLDSAPYDDHIKVEATIDEVNQCIAKGAGATSQDDFLQRVAVKEKPSKVLKRYVSNYKALSINPNTVIAAQSSALCSSWYPFTFSLSMRYKIPEIHDPGFRADTGLFDSYNNIFQKVLDCEFSSPATIRRYFSEHLVNQESVSILAEKGEIRDVLRYMSQERRQTLLKRDIEIPYEDATKEFRRRSIERDLGI